MVLLSLDFCSSEQIACHFSNWNRDLFRHGVSCYVFPMISVCLASYHLQIFFSLFFACFCSSPFWHPVKGTVDMKIIHGLCSRFLAEAAHSTCLLPRYFPWVWETVGWKLCSLWEPFGSLKSWTPEICFFPKKGRYIKHAKHLYVMLSHSLSSDCENSVMQEVVNTTLLFQKIFSMSKISFTFIILSHWSSVRRLWNYSRCFHVTTLW